MSQPYVGEIRMFGGNFAPAGWMLCQGQVVPIDQYDTLYNLIGTTYGGDGQSTFALPNLQGRLPMHQGAGFVMGQTGGVEQVTLITQQLPVHNHPMAASLNNATGNTVTGNVVGSVGATQIYREAPAASAMANQACTFVGGNQPHNNMQPYLCINFIISLFGVYPSQTQDGTMSDPFLAEIRIFPFNFAPKGWAFCNGQLMPISQNTALFSLLGTTYGGDGRSNFALPNMQGNSPMQQGQSITGSSYILGENGGTPSVTLLQSEMPQHNHPIQGNINPSDLATPSPARSLARANPGQAYTATLSNIAQFAPASSILPNGGSMPHNNLMPYLTLNFCIALQGIFPPRS